MTTMDFFGSLYGTNILLFTFLVLFLGSAFTNTIGRLGDSETSLLKTISSYVMGFGIGFLASVFIVNVIAKIMPNLNFFGLY